MDHTTYIDFICFFIKFVNGIKFSGTSYKESLLENKIKDFVSLKSTLNLSCQQDNVYDDFITVLRFFKQEVIEKISAFYDLDDIDTAYQVLTNITGIQLIKTKNFTPSQKDFISQVVTLMESKHSNFRKRNETPDNFNCLLEMNKTMMANMNTMMSTMSQFLTAFNNSNNNNNGITTSTLTDSGISSQQSNQSVLVLGDSNTTKSFEQSISIKVKNLVCKRINLQEHEKSCKLLLENGKVYPTLNSDRLPTPFFPEYKPYTDILRQRIKERQIQDMEDIKNAIETQLDEINQAINNTMDSCLDPKKTDKYNSLCKDCDNLKKHALEVSQKKTEFIIKNPLSTKLNPKGNISQSWFFEKNNPSEQRQRRHSSDNDEYDTFDNNINDNSNNSNKNSNNNSNNINNNGNNNNGNNNNNNNNGFRRPYNNNSTHNRHRSFSRGGSGKQQYVRFNTNNPPNNNTARPRQYNNKNFGNYNNNFNNRDSEYQNRSYNYGHGEARNNRRFSNS